MRIALSFDALSSGDVQFIGYRHPLYARRRHCTGKWRNEFPAAAVVAVRTVATISGFWLRAPADRRANVWAFSAPINRDSEEYSVKSRAEERGSSRLNF